MRLKSYFADTVESAMVLAGRELGEDAMLVYSRESSAETRHLGRYEVVFAADGGAQTPPRSTPQGDPGPEATTAASGEGGGAERRRPDPGSLPAQPLATARRANEVWQTVALGGADIGDGREANGLKEFRERDGIAAGGTGARGTGKRTPEPEVEAPTEKRDTPETGRYDPGARVRQTGERPPGERLRARPRRGETGPQDSLERMDAPPVSLDNDRLWAELDRRLAQLEERLESNTGGPARGGVRAGTREPRPITAEWRIHLRSQDVGPAVAARLIREAAHQTQASEPPPGGGPERALAAAAASSIRCDPGCYGPGRVTILAGQPGAGKTSAAVKLACWHASRHGSLPRLMSLDTQRMLGAEQLRRYAELLGAEFAAPLNIEEMRSFFGNGPLSPYANRYTIVDMPGCSLSNTETMEQIREISCQIPGGEVHLVLSASTRTADLFSAVERFAVIEPARLLFTRLDETSRAGGVWTLAAQTGIPVSFLSDGPRIPDDFREAHADELANLLTRPLQTHLTGAPLAASR
ncbi:MAG: hypothetical protein R2762_01310 [Bryobacteraceae bacterium]